MRNFRLLAVLALALPWVTSCYVDEQLGARPLPNTGELMRRYVSLGNSITAGFQSGGLNDSLQQRAYPVLVAAAAGAEFAVPSFNFPGCPAPLINNAPPTPIVPNPPPCALRSHQPLPPFFNNLAVPGAQAIDPIDNLAPTNSANQLTMLILGGKTQLEAMADANPTLVSVWIGGNDVLGALTDSANPGDPSQITPQADFETQIRTIYDAIDATGARGVAISVPNVTLIPYASAAAFYWCGSVSGGGACGVPVQFPPTFTVDISCSPSAVGMGGVGDATLVQWTHGIGKISAALQGTPTNLDCTDDTQVATPAEVGAMIAAVGGYNTFLAAEAAARGYAYFDINPALQDAANSGLIPPFPDLSGITVGQPIGFGPLFSLDGVHPSSTTHRLVADSVIANINRVFGTTIPIP